MPVLEFLCVFETEADASRAASALRDDLGLPTAVVAGNGERTIWQAQARKATSTPYVKPPFRRHTERPAAESRDVGAMAQASALAPSVAAAAERCGGRLQRWGVTTDDPDSHGGDSST
jgi:hypothetical protein